jgi:hypothetical protein
MKVSDSYKRVSLLQQDNICLSDSLLQCSNNYCLKRFYITCPRREVSDSSKRVSLLQHDNIYLSDSLLQCSNNYCLKRFYIRCPGGKCLTATNVLAYYNRVIFAYLTGYYNVPTITALKGFIVHAAGGKLWRTRVVCFKSNLLLMIFWLNIINYNS